LEDDVSEMPVVLDDNDCCDDMDWEPTPTVVHSQYVVGKPVEIESESESESGMLDGSGSAVMIMDDVEMEPVLVPALRRSKRLAERRVLQEKMGLVPEQVLGSIFVNGRRRSSRHL
jgi:hypothetical protein